VKVLFLDDSYHRSKKYLGYGGFVVDGSDVRAIANDVAELKRSWKIPERVELKWSPPPDHYLRTTFKGKREDLYREAIGLLADYSAQVIVAAHDLEECYGVKVHGWDFPRAKLWAAKQQFRYIAERFERPCLSQAADAGLVIADQYESKAGEVAIVRDAALVLAYGTEFQRFENVSIIPLVTISAFCPPIQLADLVVGIVVSTLAGSPYGAALFDDVAKLFLLNPHENAESFASMFSAAALGFGLIMFPRDFRSRGREIMKGMDDSYVWSDWELKPTSA